MHKPQELGSRHPQTKAATRDKYKPQSSFLLCEERVHLAAEQTEGVVDGKAVTLQARCAAHIVFARGAAGVKLTAGVATLAGAVVLERTRTAAAATAAAALLHVG